MRSEKRRRLNLVKEWGGVCQRCGYSKCPSALHFHHKDASEKHDWNRGRGNAAAAEILSHPERFELLCSNCHIEIHDEIDRENKIILKCLCCDDEFEAEKYKILNGRNKYCCRRCQHVHRGIIARTEEAIHARFKRNVRMTEAGCWEWTSSTTRGFPVMQFKKPDDRLSPRSVRRVSYELYVGEIPGDSLRLMSVCGNALCVRPDHLSSKGERLIIAKYLDEFEDKN